MAEDLFPPFPNIGRIGKLRLLIRGSDKQYRYQKRSVKKRKIPKILMPAENGFRPRMIITKTQA